MEQDRDKAAGEFYSLARRHGVDVNREDSVEGTPLVLACTTLRLKTVKVLAAYAE